MAKQATQAFLRILLIALLMTFAFVSARSSHFEEGSEVNSEADGPQGNIVENGLTPLQLDLLAQRISELNQIPPLPVAWERLVRNPEVKRQRRYQKCYFNPISCFRK